jgi:TM2 domain-containing membrane protein YozV
MTQGIPGGKSKVLAGVLNIVISGVGNIYLGYIGKGVAQLLLSCLCVGAIWSIVDAIFIFTGKIDKDASGNPLV